MPVFPLRLSVLVVQFLPDSHQGLVRPKFPMQRLPACARVGVMSDAYEEILEGETFLRRAPGSRHEKICAFLHRWVASSLQPQSAARLLTTRSIVQVSPGTMVRPDLTLVTAATGKPWLLAEIIDSSDHRTDTVVKKQIYEDTKVPRLWMIDPRYDNLEVYHGTAHGLALRKILAGRDILEEPLLPEFRLQIQELFSGADVNRQ
jgi:Uma2 family endonuclease